MPRVLRLSATGILFYNSSLKKSHEIVVSVVLKRAGAAFATLECRMRGTCQSSCDASYERSVSEQLVMQARALFVRPCETYYPTLLVFSTVFAYGTTALGALSVK